MRYCIISPCLFPQSKNERCIHSLRYEEVRRPDLQEDGSGVHIGKGARYAMRRRDYM